MADDIVDVFVEVPKGSRNKYEHDPETGTFRLDRMLYSAVHYPGDYGYVPETLARDGDRLDALVVLGERTFPGCLIVGRVVGMLDMADEKGEDVKILCVPDGDPRWRHVQDLIDVPDHLLAEIAHFFRIYKNLEGKGVQVRGWRDRAEALRIVKDARGRAEG